MAVYLASSREPAPSPTAEAPTLPTVDVLVAKSEIPLGRVITASDLQWQTWPESAAAGVIRRSNRSNAESQIAGMLARSAFVEGEPIRETKLVHAGGAGFMAAVLAPGMRAISIEISPETGAGGFILPNDRVDVLLSRREAGGGTDIVVSEIILGNIRVLAIDQAPKEKDGQNSVVGKTATLELKPNQAETLAQARQSGTLSLALRALVDAGETTPTGRRESVNVVRYGIPTTSFQK